MDLTTIIAAPAVVVAAFVGGWLSRPKTQAEAHLADASADAITTKRLYDEINRLVLVVDGLRTEFANFKTNSFNEINNLRTSLIDATTKGEVLLGQLNASTKEVTRLCDLMERAARQLDAGETGKAEATLAKADEGPKGKV